MKKYLLHIIIFCFFINLVTDLKAAHCDDCPKSLSDSIIEIETDLSAISKMSEDDLNTLVDLLFDFDTVSYQLINEIKNALTKYKKTTIDTSFVKPIKSTFLSQNFYTVWDEEKLFPKEDMLSLNGDTSVTLLLNSDFNGEYFHPFNGNVTSDFGWRDNKSHNGIDIDVNRGDNIAAAFDGVVRVSKYHGGFGNVIIIRHYNGLETIYAHLSKLKAKVGQVVIAGQIVGLGGSTGHSTGTHLHFEVRFKGVPINPKYLISFDTKCLRYDEVSIKKTKWGLVAYPKNISTYTIEKGDTLLSLAKQFATTTSAIKKANGISGSIRLKPGQTISLIQ